MLKEQEVLDRLEVLYKSGKKAYYKNMSKDIKVSVNYEQFKRLWKSVYNKHRVLRIKKGSKIDLRKQVGKYRSTDRRKFIVCRYVPTGNGMELTHYLIFNKLQYTRYMKRVFAGIKAHCSLNSVLYSDYIRDNYRINKLECQFLIDLKYVRYSIGIDCFPIDLESAQIKIRDKFRFNPYEEYGYNTLEPEDTAQPLFIDDLYREI